MLISSQWSRQQHIYNSYNADKDDFVEDNMNIKTTTVGEENSVHAQESACGFHLRPVMFGALGPVLLACKIVYCLEAWSSQHILFNIQNNTHCESVVPIC